ncbi:Ig-like domain-containing protein [Thermoflexus sp.]|uniref:Ig-like domain-containing protein n=1 Tax=Thermoflexus sp. TaxID=1969742 RepID=UPI0035E40FFC
MNRLGSASRLPLLLIVLLSAGCIGRTPAAGFPPTPTARPDAALAKPFSPPPQPSVRPPPFDVGLSVIVVSVTQITKGNNPDWLGPYYKAYVTFSNAGRPNQPVSPEQSLTFGADGGCDACWQGSYSVPSDSSVYFSLKLVDDQGWWGGEQPVHIVGESDTLRLVVSPDIGYIGGSVPTSYMQQTDDGFVFEGSFAGSHGERTASITVQVMAQSDLQHQAWLRHRIYTNYRQLMYGASGAWGEDWLDWWNENVQQLKAQLFPLLMTSFGLMTLPLDMAAGMVAMDLLPDWKDILGDILQEALEGVAEDWLNSARQFSTANLTVPDLGAIDIANIELSWDWCSGGQLNEVAYWTDDILRHVAEEKTALRQNNRTGIIGSLSQQITATQLTISAANRAIRNLADSKKPETGYPIVCNQAGTDYLIRFLEEYKGFVARDEKYLEDTLKLLQPPPRPKVVAVEPTGILSVTAPIRVFFSEAMDPDSIRPRSQDPQEYPIQPPEAYRQFSFTWSPDGMWLTLTPVDRLDYNTTYTLELTQRLTNRKGIPLEPYTLRFTTESGPVPPTAIFYHVSVNSTYGAGALSKLQRGGIYAAQPTSLDYWTVRRSLGPTVEAVFRTNDPSRRFECWSADKVAPGVVEHSGQGVIGEYNGKLYFIPIGRDCPSYFVLELLDKVSPLPSTPVQAATLEIKTFEGNASIAEQVGLRPGARFPLEPIALQEYSSMGTDIGSGIIHAPGSPLDGKELRIYALLRDPFTVIPDKPQAAFAIRLIPGQVNLSPVDFVVYSMQEGMKGAWRLTPPR